MEFPIIPYTMINVSKKHHYLPRYYLKGFANSDNCFYVYDKQKDNIFPSSPDDTFFENYLNTVTFPDGTKSDFLEDMYTKEENEFWEYLDKIRTSTPGVPIPHWDKMHLFYFLLNLYWRLPKNIELVEKLSEKAFIDDNEFDYFKLQTKTGKKPPWEIEEEIKKSPSFKKTFKQIVPFSSFFKDKSWGTKLQNWRFCYTGDQKSWYIVGDSPFIIKNLGDKDIINPLKEFIFPISGKILLINVSNAISKTLTPEFSLQFNIAIIERSNRFVACQNKSFLEALVNHYKIYVQFGKTDIIIKELFDMLLQQ